MKICHFSLADYQSGMHWISIAFNSNNTFSKLISHLPILDSWMLTFIISFFSGYVTSLVGTLIPGGLNATAMEITVSKGKKAGLLFGLGAALVEIIYIRLTLLGIAFFVKQSSSLISWNGWWPLYFLQRASIFLFVHLARPKRKKVPKARSGNHNTHAFLLGMALKAVNPAQFGFWIFWSTYLISQNLLKPESIHYTLFVLGLGSATFTGYALYVFFGEYIQTKSFFHAKEIWPRGGNISLPGFAFVGGENALAHKLVLNCFNTLFIKFC